MAFFLSKKWAAKPVEKDMPLYANAEKRIYACAIDFLILLFILLLIHQFRWFLVLQFLYFSFFWWQFYGQTFGNEIMGIRVVTVDHKPLTFSVSLLRALGFLLSEVTIIGFAWILFDKKKQGFHDKLARTIVINKL